MVTAQSSTRNSTDIITLNVGGKHFTTCKSTLMRLSPYFEAMFSKYWTSNDSDHDIIKRSNYDDSDICFSSSSSNGNVMKEHHNQNNNMSSTLTQLPVVFIDKDPIPFQYILKYMREGHIDLPSDNYALAKDVILQAQYFGIYEFISHVKSRSVQNCIVGYETYHFDFTNLKVDDIDEIECINIFDQKYRTLNDAFDDECLPYSYFHKYNNSVCLQVGDVKHTLNKTTVRAKSALLESIIDSGPSFDSSPRIHCIDQDSEAFSYLLHYIRYSQLDLPQDNKCLFRRILFCAQYLQMNDFLILVKARTMMGIELHEAPMGLDPMDSNFVMNTREITEIDRHYAFDFDRRFISIDSAFTQNALPLYFFKFDCF